MIPIAGIKEKTDRLASSLIAEACPIEQGKIVLQMKGLGLNQWDIADLIGKDQSFVSQRERLMRLPAATLEAVRLKKISINKALETLKGAARFRSTGSPGESPVD